MRAITIAIISATVLGLSACQSSISERSFTADVIHGLSQNGMAYIQRSRQNGDLQRIMQEIADGNGLLIDNAYLMRRSLTDSEKVDLKNSLAFALKSKPEKVLALMPAHYKFDELCTIPHSVADQDRHHYISETIRVLTTSNTRFKARQQQQCLTQLESVKKSESI